MKSIKPSIILFWVLMLLQGPVFADGNRLLSSCEVVLDSVNTSQISGDSYHAGFCLGFVQGVYQLNGAYQSWLKVDQPLFCTPPEGISNGQAVRIVNKYLQEHPEQLHEEEYFLVIKALREAFPCKD